MRTERPHPTLKSAAIACASTVLVAVSVVLAPTADGQSWTFPRLAGPAGGAGYDDGPATAALLSDPYGVAVDGAGNRYVADLGNHTIRRIDAAGNVTTVAGLAGNPGFADGKGGTARFSNPRGLVADASGNVYVADAGNHRIRKIDPTGIVSTLAGTGVRGLAEGPGSTAQFDHPAGVAVDASGNVYVADYFNNRIRKIDPSGTVSTLAGDGTFGFADGPGSTAQFKYPASVAVDASGFVYVADSGNHRIRKIDPSGTVSTLAGTGVAGFADGPVSTAQFKSPHGVAVAVSGDVVVADYNNYRIRRIDTSGSVSTLAGTGTQGVADGPGSTARFYSPIGVAVDGAGIVYVADSSAQRIRKLDTAGNVSTLVGHWTVGFADGPGSTARFNLPYGVAADASGNVYIADFANHRIRRVDTAHSVSTLAGTGTAGFADGPGTSAQFNGPYGVCVDSSGNVLVGDAFNNRIRRIDASGNVSTLAGTGVAGFADGPATTARFYLPSSIAVDASGNAYVADVRNHRIRKIDTSGIVSTWAGSWEQGFADGPGSLAQFNWPQGVAVDSSGNVYVADYANMRIRKVDPSRVVSTLAGNGNFGFVDGPGSTAEFRYPCYVAVDAGGSVYVADYGNNRVRKVDTSEFVTTIGGNGSSGSFDGTGTAAGFKSPCGIAVDPMTGGLIVSDSGNNTIRVGEPALPDIATIDVTTGPGLTPRQLDTTPQTATSWKWQLVRRPTGSTATLSSTTVRNPTFTPDVADVYVFRLTASDASGVTSGTIVTLTATSGCTPPATPEPANDGPKCEGGTVQLSVGYVADATYSWTGPNGFTSSQMLPALAGVTAAMAGDYFVTVTVGLCTSAVGTTAVSVAGKPALPVITAPESLSPGGSGTAAVSSHAGSTYSWTIRNGTLDSGQGTHEVGFTAGSGPDPVDLAVVETNVAGCPSEEATAQVAIGAPCHALAVGVMPAGSGSVEVGTPQNCSGGWVAGTAIALTANASGGRPFAGWLGAGGALANATASPTTFTISEGAAVTAVFGPWLAPVATPIVVGATNTFAGFGFTAGSVIKLFVSTASGAEDTSPAGWVPTSWTPTSLTWAIPASVPLGQGFGSLLVVNTDQGYIASNVEGQLLRGDEADGLSTILAINGVGLSAYDPSIPGAHVETVLAAGSTVTITGTGFNGPLVNLYTAAGNVGPLTPLAGGTSTSFQVVVPETVPAGPGTFQVVNSGSGWTLSNAVAAVLRARIVVTSVEVAGGTVTVTGDGFCALTVINLFNAQGGGVVNLGGLAAGGAPVIPLNVLDAQHFTFAVPAGAQAGPAYVMALNPPFTPCTSSGTDPGGAFPVP